MNDETIVAVFDAATEADAAVRDLQAVVPASAVSRHAAATGGTTDATPQAREPGFWASLFGGRPEHDTRLYDRSLERGSVVVTVKASAEQAARVTEILERHNPVDLDERASSFGLSATGGTAIGVAAGEVPATGLATGGAAGGRPADIAATGPDATRQASGAAADGDTLELAEESLTVGKRAVDRGTTRVRRFVVETPVEEQVTLRDETVSVERRPVADGRPASSADFSDRVIEMTETGEEAVVSKTARVKEEVVLSKAATERVETVRDTVRREDVKIEKAPDLAPDAERGTKARETGTPASRP